MSYTRVIGLCGRVSFNDKNKILAERVILQIRVKRIFLKHFDFCIKLYYNIMEN
jgi:hypothetical protein